MPITSLIGRSVAVAVPATIANLGAGYDVLAMAIDLHNELRVTITGSVEHGAGRIEYSVTGEGAAVLVGSRENLAIDAIYRGLTAAGVPDAERMSLTISAVNAIPLSRGLGSSAAAIVAGLCAGAALGSGSSEGFAPGSCVDRFDDAVTDALFAEAARREGHPDNAAAALFGGLVASGSTSDGLAARLITVPDDAVPVVLIPTLELPTSEMRSVLPKQISMADAAHNASRLALGVAALEAGDLRGFALLADDRLHQPVRATRYTAMPALIDAARTAGAVSACLAGAGSSILAIVDDAGGAGDEVIERVIAALDAAAQREKVGGHAEQFEVEHDGARIIA